MDADSLADVVDLGLHLADGGGLQVEHLEEVVGKSVDLVGHACKRLCCVTYYKRNSNCSFVTVTMVRVAFSSLVPKRVQTNQSTGSSRKNEKSKLFVKISIFKKNQFSQLF